MTVALSEDQCVEALFNGVPVKNIYSPDILEKYNSLCDILDIEKLSNSLSFTNKWFMPEEYNTLNLVEYFSHKINSDIEALRVAEELDLFLKTDNEQLLKYLIYLGKVIEDNNIVTGVGRGSSVSLYVLYLCKIHKVNSIKYNLSYNDFFKIKQ